jgi:3',5'-cyclic AMP phosphodiesterase CpdA
MVIGLDPLARLRAVLDEAISDHQDAVALILLGDLTHHGDPEGYATLRAALAEVPMPIIPMLGNHDHRDAFLAVFPDAPQMASGHVQHSFDVGNYRIITLDSLDGPPYTADHQAGRICPARMDFLKKALAKKGEMRALVFVHHPPFETGIVGMDVIRLANGPAFLAVLAQYSDVHLVCGHIHRTISGSTSGVPWSILKSSCHQVVMDLQSHNLRLSSNEPGSYGLALLMDDGVVVHSKDVDIPGRQVFGGSC